MINVKIIMSTNTEVTRVNIFKLRPAKAYSTTRWVTRENVLQMRGIFLQSVI